MSISENFTDLINKGFDVVAGLEKCANDAEIYMEVLQMAWEEGKEKIPFIRGCVEEKDFNRYEIEVHGLKNAAKIIGCMDLAERAAEQEIAVKEEQFEDIIDTGVESLLVEYERVVSILDIFFQK